MQIMNQEKSNAEKLMDSVSDLAVAYRSLISIQLVEHTSLGVSCSIIGVLAVIMAVFVLLFTGLGAAWWLGEYLHNMKVGLFIVGGFYSLLFIFLALTAHKFWIPRLRNRIIKKIYEQDN